MPLARRQVHVTGAAAATDAVTVRVSGDTEPRFVVNGNGQIELGSGSATPDVLLERQAANVLRTVDDFQVHNGSTKGYRLRHSGSNLDFDASGADMVFSVFSTDPFGGTQRTYLAMESGSQNLQVVGQVQYRTGYFGTVRHSISGAAAGGVVFNEDGADADTRIEGDTDANLVFVDASTDRVGIGTATPATKLDVNGTVNATGLQISGTTVGNWQTYSPTFAGTGWALGNGTMEARYSQIGKTVHFFVKVTFGSTSTFGSGSPNVTLPVTAASVFRYTIHNASVGARDTGTNTYGWHGWISTDGTYMEAYQPGSSDVSVTINSTNPFTWASGDQIWFGCTYEAV